MNLSREEAQQILDALQSMRKIDTDEAIDLLTVRLAEGEQEPVICGMCGMCGYTGTQKDSLGQCVRCHWDELIPSGDATLRSALNAMLTQFWMDEDEWNKPTFDQARAALLQPRLAEPDAGANVEFPTPAYLRVSDDPVDISIIDYYTEPQLRSYADARVVASRLAEGEQEPAYAKVEEEILTRYRVEPTGRGFWPAVVKCGTGAMDIFIGTKKQAERVRQALQTACLDGAFMASNAAQQGALKSEQELLK